MSTPCQGCKALVIQTADDYNVYSLQRAIYPVDPLMIIPQPTSWVQLVCEDGAIIKKLYTQKDDWVTFWQQMLAECANHTIPVEPVVISEPDGDTEDDDDSPVIDPKPDPDPDPMPGPDTVVAPPPVAPPAPSPVPDPGGQPFSWPDGQAPNFNATPVGEEDNPTVNPYESPDPNYHWTGWVIDVVLGTVDGGPDVNSIDHSCDGFFGDYLWAYIQQQYAAMPDPKFLRWYQTPTWYYLQEQGPGIRHKMMTDCSRDLVWFGSDPDPAQPGEEVGVVHEGNSTGYFWQLGVHCVIYVGTPI
jgi:hypothetical protein